MLIVSHNRCLVLDPWHRWIADIKQINVTLHNHLNGNHWPSLKRPVSGCNVDREHVKVGPRSWEWKWTSFGNDDSSAVMKCVGCPTSRCSYIRCTAYTQHWRRIAPPCSCASCYGSRADCVSHTSRCLGCAFELAVIAGFFLFFWKTKLE